MAIQWNKSKRELSLFYATNRNDDFNISFGNDPGTIKRTAVNYQSTEMIAFLIASALF